MSDYTETYSKVSGNTINVTEFETEFQAIETAIATKANKTGAPATTNNIATLSAAGDLQDGGNTVAEVLARANHTGTQTMSTISDAGTAATLDVGTGANNIVQLDGSSALPAVDCSALSAATTSAAGVVELATDAEAQAGTDTGRAVTPDNLGATVLGIGQTWQDVSGSRAIDTVYQNTTGRPIMVSIGRKENGTQNYWEILVGATSSPATIVGGLGDSNAVVDISSCAVVIPDDWYYKLASTGGSGGTIHYWAELR